MVKFTSIIGHKAFDKETGKILGVINDAVISKEKNILSGLFLSKNRVLSKRTFIEMESIDNILSDGVFINNKINKKFKIDKNKNKIISEILNKISVFTNDGDEIGKVSDFLIDEKSGRIEGFEISEGLSEDIYFGRKLLPIIGKVEFGEDIMTVNKECYEEIISKKGLKNYLEKEE